jgi:hypothetical protein
MGLFRRSARTPDSSAGIEEFWRWWAAEGATLTASSIEERDPERVVAPLSQRIQAVHPGLAWELGAGTSARHLLVVSPEGDATIRAVARRWLRSAPAPDATWEYADLRQPALDVTSIVLGIGDRKLAFDDLRVAARRTGHRFDVTMHHPAFPDLPEEARSQVAFLALDATLGEADTELWIGRVSTSTAAPLDAFGVDGLRVVVRDLKDDVLDDGEPRWALMTGETDAGPVLAMAQIPLSPLLSPDLDRHVVVHVPYADRTPEGFPEPATLEALRRFEDHLLERLGGSGNLVAHETHQGTRTLHFYVDSTTPAAAQLTAAVTGWPGGKVTVDAADDPGWDAVAHLRS